LGQNFKDKTTMEFNVHNAKRHLAQLKIHEYEVARTYILNTPEQIKTDLRKELTEFMNLRNEVVITLNSNSSFFNVPRVKLLHYYPEIVANSHSQFNGAEHLAAVSKFGMAISHLLISTEEMIKALVVVMDAKGFDFRNVKGMDIFLKITK
jgi:hypothetical protein